MNGQRTFSCRTSIDHAAGTSVVTIEGPATGDLLHPVQKAAYGGECPHQCEEGLLHPRHDHGLLWPCSAKSRSQATSEIRKWLGYIKSAAAAATCQILDAVRRAAKEGAIKPRVRINFDNTVVGDDPIDHDRLFDRVEFNFSGSWTSSRPVGSLCRMLGAGILIAVGIALGGRRSESQSRRAGRRLLEAADERPGPPRQAHIGKRCSAITLLAGKVRMRWARSSRVDASRC